MTYIMELRHRTTGMMQTVPRYESDLELISLQCMADAILGDEYEVAVFQPDAFGIEEPGELGGSVCGCCKSAPAMWPYIAPWNVLCNECFLLFRKVRSHDDLLAIGERADA